MIPRMVHMTWKTKDVLNSKSFLIENGIKTFLKLNPGWVVDISTDDEVDNYLKEVLLAEDYDLLKDRHIVEKSDLWRLFKIYLEGGMYLDIDRLCNKSLDYLLEEGVKWVLPYCREFDFSHDIMISAQGNPVYLEAIALYLSRIRDGHRSTYFLGPQTYMHAITKAITGEMINTDPGAETFQKIRDEVTKLPFIRTFEENPPYTTVLFDGNKEELDFEQHKRDFYKEQNVKHWTGEW